MFETGAVNEDNNTTYNLINPHSFSGFPDTPFEERGARPWTLVQGLVIIKK